MDPQGGLDQVQLECSLHVLIGRIENLGAVRTELKVVYHVAVDWQCAIDSRRDRRVRELDEVNVELVIDILIGPIGDSCAVRTEPKVDNGASCD